MPSPLLRRSALDRLVTGTAGGLAERLRVDPIVVRLGFVLLTLAGGLGLLLYGLGFVVSSEPEPDADAPERPRRIRTVATSAIVLGCLLVLRDLGVWFGDSVVVPATVAVVGSSVLGGRAAAASTPRRASPGHRDRGRPHGRRLRDGGRRDDLARRSGGSLHHLLRIRRSRCGRDGGPRSRSGAVRPSRVSARRQVSDENASVRKSERPSPLICTIRSCRHSR